MQRVPSGKPSEGQGLPRPCHGHVVQPPRGVRVLPPPGPVPTPVQDNDVVELKPPWPGGR